jgi:hypothetical protein
MFKFCRSLNLANGSEFTEPIAKHVKLFESQRHIGFVLHVARHFLLHIAPSCLNELNSYEINRTAVWSKGNSNCRVAAAGGNRINPLTPELNHSAQRCQTRIFYWGFCFLNRAFR